MAGTVVLLAWCAGVAAGYLGWLNARPAQLLVAAVVPAAVAVPAWIAGRQDRGALVPAALLLGAAMATAGLARGELGRPPVGAGRVAAYTGQTVSLNGRVQSASVAGGGATGAGARLQSFQLDIAGLTAAGRMVKPAGLVLVQSRGHAEVFDGQRVTVRGTLSRPRAVGPGGIAGYADRLERMGVEAELSATSVTPLEAPSPVSVARVAAEARAGLVAAIRDLLPEPEATVVLGEVAGIRGALPAGVDADLVQSGLVHILAISGIKVAIVAGLLQAVTIPLLGRRGAVLGIVGIAFYTLVGGATASAVRSALMGSLGLVGGAIRRDTDVLRSLLLAGSAMLAQRPSLVADLSFQYSFLGVLGIHLFAPPVQARLSFLPRPFRVALAVTVAAQLGTLPLTAHYFAVVPLLAPVANALVLPSLPLAIAVGLLLAGMRSAVGVLPEAWSRLASAVVVPPAALELVLARLALVVAHLARVVPGSAMVTPGFGAPATAGYYAATCTVALGRVRRWPLPRVAAAAAGAALVALVLLGRPDDRLHVVFPAGVSGPVAVVVAPDGATMLIGTGASAAALGPALDEVLPPAAPLPGLPRRLDAVALTGGSREEAGGLATVAGRHLGTLLLPVGMSGAAATGVAAGLSAAGANTVRLRPGDSVSWHGLEVVARAGGDGGQLALGIGWGDAHVLVISSADGGVPPAVPRGDYAAVALGSAAADPGLTGVNAAEVVVQDGGADASAPVHPVARGVVQAAGSRLWRVSRDGELRLVCDRSGCARG